MRERLLQLIPILALSLTTACEYSPRQLAFRFFTDQRSTLIAKGQYMELYGFCASSQEEFDDFSAANRMRYDPSFMGTADFNAYFYVRNRKGDKSAITVVTDARNSPNYVAGADISLYDQNGQLSIIDTVGGNFYCERL